MRRIPGLMVAAGRGASCSLSRVVLVAALVVAAVSVVTPGVSDAAAEVVNPASVSPELAPAQCGFLDVTDEDYFARGTCWLKLNDITTGLDGNPEIYGPNVVVNRAQMAAFLWRAVLATQPDPPLALTTASVVVGDQRLTVGFTAPDADGGSPVTNYE